MLAAEIAAQLKAEFTGIRDVHVHLSIWKSSVDWAGVIDILWKGVGALSDIGGAAALLVAAKRIIDRVVGGAIIPTPTSHTIIRLVSHVPASRSISRNWSMGRDLVNLALVVWGGLLLTALFQLLIQHPYRQEDVVLVLAVSGTASFAALGVSLVALRERL